MDSVFDKMVLGLPPPIEAFSLNKAFQDDLHDSKVNLAAGVYRSNEGEPWILPVVRKVESAMAVDEAVDHEYLPVLGLEAFSSAATALLLGKDSAATARGRVVGVQTLSGTGALRLAAEFLARNLRFDVVYCSRPSYENHKLIFLNGGFKKYCEYRYWNPESRSIDLDGMLSDLQSAPKYSAIILHACAHNPTGCDPTLEQWQKIADVVKERHLFPIFDSAYQGFASGDLDNDARAVRLFVDQGIELICTQSFAKNFGLYNERIGNFILVVNNPRLIPEIKNQLTSIVRGNYSTPPNHGARIVVKILSDPDLYKMWIDNLQTMANRIKEMRRCLHEKLLEIKTPGCWEHVVNQIGMFSYTGLSEKQVECLINKYHIYLLRSGRINMCGLNQKNVEYVARAFHEVVTNLS